MSSSRTSQPPSALVITNRAQHPITKDYAIVSIAAFLNADSKEIFAKTTYNINQTMKVLIANDLDCQFKKLN